MAMSLLSHWDWVLENPNAPTRSADEVQAVELARTLAGAVSAGRYLVGEIEVSLRAHIGLAIAPSDGTEVPELVRRVSLSAGRAAFQGQAESFWNGDFGAMTASDLGLLADLRLASTAVNSPSPTNRKSPPRRLGWRRSRPSFAGRVQSTAMCRRLASFPWRRRLD